MEYSDFLDRVKALDFIHDEETADSAVKAVLGIFASNMEEAAARNLVDKLPGPLTLEKLRGHQKHPSHVTVEHYEAELADQFHISAQQARNMINTILEVTERATGIHMRTLLEA